MKFNSEVYGKVYHPQETPAQQVDGFIKKPEKNPETEKYGAGADDGTDAGSDETGSEETGSEETGSEETGSEETGGD